MPQTYKVGDSVQYHAVGGASETSGGNTTGKIIKILTEPQPAGETGGTVKASPENPRYLIRNDTTGKETAYKEDNIMGIAK